MKKFEKCGKRLKRPWTGVRHCVLSKGHDGPCQDSQGLQYPGIQYYRRIGRAKVASENSPEREK